MSQYLQAVINQQAVGIIMPLTALNHFNPILHAWGQPYILQTKLSGSNAKGTAVKCCVDVDIFISLSPHLSKTLAEIYDSLFAYFQGMTGYNPRKQNVSTRVNFSGGTVDLVPGRRQNVLYSDHSLYVKKKGTWTQTNVDTHIATVTQANKSDLIKLVKIWRERQRLEFPSLYLELAVIRATQGQFFWNLEAEFRHVMGWLYSNIENARFVDPANTNNILSDDLTNAEKTLIKSKAGLSSVVHDISKAVW